MNFGRSVGWQRQRLLFAVLATLLLLPCQAHSAEPFRAFLSHAQDRGFGEAALEYIEEIRTRKDLPDDIRQVLDLEMAKSLQIAASETVNAGEAAKRLTEAGEYLQKFLKEHPKHPETAKAYYRVGEIMVARAQRILDGAQTRSDPIEREARMTDGRALLTEARKQFVTTSSEYDKRLVAALASPQEPEPAPPAAPPTTRGAPSAPALSPAEKRRIELEENWADSQIRLASTDLAIGRTLSDPTAKRAALKLAAKEFDSVYQRFGAYRLGLYSNLWHAKVAVEMGDIPLATNVLAEVLANAPEKGERIDASLEPILSDAEMYWLQLLASQGKHSEVVSDAQNWLKFYPNFRATAGAQGVSVELSRAELILAEKLEKVQRGRAVRIALGRLAELTRINGPHQRDAILLRRQYAAEEAQTVDSFAEAMAVADAAANDNRWNEAAVAYEKAIELGRKGQKAPELSGARLSLARALNSAGKTEEAIAVAEQLAREQPEPQAAPQAGALAVNLALNGFVNAKDKEAARQRLFKLADFMAQRWPTRSEADEARLALGKLELSENQISQAIVSFEAVKPTSDRYPSALYLAAQAHWAIYLAEQKGASAAPNKTPAAEHRQRAIEELEKSLALEKQANRSATALPQSMMDTMLLLSEIYFETGQASAVRPLSAPLLANLRKAQGQKLDTFGLRVAVIEAKSALSLQQLPETIAAATVLAARAEDSPAVDAFLVAILQQVRGILKEEKPPSSYAELVALVAERKHLQPLGRLIVGNESVRAGRSKLARAQYELLLKSLESGPDRKPDEVRLVSQARLRLIELLRDDKLYAEALEQAELLIRDNPQRLDPLLAKGRVLEQWAKVDEQQLDAAIQQWTAIRLELQRLGKASPEYYEAVYGAASCLFQRSQQKHDESSKKAAYQLLKSTLVLHASLDGPSSVARYQELLERISKAH